MRTTTRLCLVLAVVATTGLVAVPAATAGKQDPGYVSIKGKIAHKKADKKQNKKIQKAQDKADKAHERIGDLKDWNQSLSDWNNSQEQTITSVQNTVTTIVAGVPAIIDGLTQLQAGLLALQDALEDTVAPALTQLGDGLLAIQAALNNTTTGLVGLNLARPQFGVFSVAGAFLGGTGTVASGPSGAATKGGAAPDVDGLYVVDFNNDVSARMLAVNVFPYVPASIGGGGTTPTGTAVNCAASASVDAVCDVVLAASGGDPQNVLVQIGDGSSSGAVNGFSVTALSG